MIIKQWEHAGMTCALRHGFNDVPCGYVLIPDGHPLHGVGYNDADGAGIHAHGGLTFAGPIEGDEDWWLGFDMGHYGDLDLATLTPLRTDAECIAETEMLAEQLAERGA